MPSRRFWKLDASRGVLIIGLVIFHLLYDLQEYTPIDLSMILAWWQLVRVVGAAAFLAIVGISLSLSFRRRGIAFGKHSLLRGVGLLALGLLITLATYWFDPATYVRFGILSLIGASIILALVAVHRPLLSLIGGIVIVVEGMVLSVSPMMPSMIGWIAPSPFLQDSLDYYPLLPWLGFVLIGIYLGYRWFPTTEAPAQATPRVFLPIAWCGRHSLLIYLLHQPMLLLLLRLLQLA